MQVLFTVDIGYQWLSIYDVKYISNKDCHIARCQVYQRVKTWHRVWVPQCRGEKPMRKPGIKKKHPGQITAIKINLAWIVSGS